MKIVIGADHAGFRLKEYIKSFLLELGNEVIDMGTNSEERVDYPVFGERVARAVAEGKADLGILICGSGIGMSMVANKVPGVRAALCHEPFSARLSREHNNANILCMGGRIIGREMAEEIVRVFLATEFAGGRHEKRINLMHQLEGK
ncbi:MAG: ribose 5-phosphate isomerase B [Acidobacteria bacterium]|nr:ribose 5-phosphate isomerase B [Acidobacteriota bacterium]